MSESRDSFSLEELRSFLKPVLLLSGLVFLSTVCVLIFTGMASASAVFGALLAGLLAGAALFLVIRNLYLLPLKSFERSVRSLTRGDAAVFLGLARADEIGRLSRALGEMAESLRARVEAAVRDKEEIKAVLSSMVDGVLVVDERDRLVHVSPSVRRVLDLRAISPEGRHYWEVIRQDEMNALIKRAFAVRKPLTQDLALPGAEEKFVHVQLSPVNFSDGRPGSLVVVLHDISAMKKYDRMRSEFVANVSHELKTPLTSIKGFVETLKSGAIDDRPQAMRFLDIIENQARRLEDLVSDILTLSHAESKNGNGHGHAQADVSEKAVTALKPVIDAVAALHSGRIRNKRLVLAVDIAGGLPPVRVERSQMEQVVGNLVDNAVKYTPDGGRVAVRAALEGAEVRVDVEDSGIGIAAEHQSRIFERFYRVDKARSRDQGGTGLGLSIVKHIVLQHQGRVTVASQPGRGSVFSVFLPAA